MIWLGKLPRSKWIRCGKFTENGGRFRKGINYKTFLVTGDDSDRQVDTTKE